MTDVARAQLAGGETREDATPTPLHILLLGEGNLSFTHALVRKVVKSSHFGRAASPHGGHGRVCAITATTMDAEKELREKYPECVPILAYFHTKTRVPVRYVGEVNATRIEASLRVGMGEAPPAYDLIFFNNPHVGVEDLHRQRALLSHFFQSANELNAIHGTFTSSHAQQVIVTLCDDQLHRWAVLDCAARSGYVCVASVPVTPADYPEYANKRHQSDAKFPYQDMFHYYFMQGAQVRCSALEEVMAAYAEINIPQLQMHTWKEIALHHCHGDDEAAGASTGNDSSEVGPYAAQIANDVAAEVASIYSRASSIAIPLLHPKLALYASATAVRKEAGQGSIAASAHYSPYLNVDCISYLYQLQAKIEMSGVQPTSSSSSPPQVSIPPQLDTRVLGRPLTDREAKKLTRFHEKYGNHTKNDASPHSTSDIHVCSICSPPRSFGCAADLARHNTTHLDSCSRPLMHSQVQHQIIEDGSGAGKQCLVCDLRFRREEDYDDHLRFLDPTEFNRRFICSDCNPEKEFADSRALQQHLLHVHVATVGVERSAT